MNAYVPPETFADLYRTTRRHITEGYSHRSDSGENYVIFNAVSVSVDELKAKQHSRVLSRALAQALSNRLPTATARVQSGPLC